MVRYLLLRTLVFFGCVALLWLVGLRPTDSQDPRAIYLVVGAAVLSMLISWLVLKRFLGGASASVAHRLEERAAHQHEPHRGLDEEAEDAEIGADDYR